MNRLDLTDDELQELFDAMCVVGCPDRGPEGEGWNSDERQSVCDKISAAWYKRFDKELFA